jgi:hypothetical protein
VPKKRKDSNYLKLKKLWKKHNIAKGSGDLEKAKLEGKKIIALQKKMKIGYVADFSHLEEIKI